MFDSNLSYYISECDNGGWTVVYVTADGEEEDLNDGEPCPSLEDVAAACRFSASSFPQPV